MRSSKSAPTSRARTPQPTTWSKPPSVSSHEGAKVNAVSATASALSGGSTAQAELAHEEGPSNETLGIWLFIVSEAVMFGAFFAQYFYNRILSTEWPTRAGLPAGFERVAGLPSAASPL